MKRISIVIKKLEMKSAIEFALDRQRIEGYCRACPNYGKLWSCPPLLFDPSDRLKEYETLFLIGTFLFYQEKERNLNLGKKKVEDYRKKTLNPLREAVYTELLKLEKKKEVLIFDMGSCVLCEKCSREDGFPCKKTDKMRYSLEALGFDVAAMMREYFQVELKWAGEKLPPYYVLVSAVAAKEGEEPSELGTLEERLRYEPFVFGERSSIL